MSTRTACLFILLAILLTACQSSASAAVPTSILYPIPTVPPPTDRAATALIPIRDIPPTATITPSPTPTITPSPTPSIKDYDTLAGLLQTYVDNQSFTLGIGFVDVQTGQTISINGNLRHYALSTFKGPLAAYYLWQIERGLIEMEPADLDYILPMMEISSNPATTCVIKRVGGLTAFNDWLAYQGLSREHNFVLTWHSWPCEENGEEWIPDRDDRYIYGDASLSLPGGSILLQCAPAGTIRCDKAFAPVELAGFYARLARSDILDGPDTGLWLSWTDRTREGSPLLESLPDSDRIHVYSKNGFRAADAYYGINFFHEAGIIDTGGPVYTLAVFMTGHPNWPGTGAIGDVSRIVYDYVIGIYE